MTLSTDIYPGIDKLLDKTKIQLISRKDSVFITTILFSLEFKWDLNTEQVMTDGKYLYVNPEYFMTISEQERQTLLVRPAWHIAFMHLIRSGNRDFMQWSYACQIVVNNMLVDTGFTLNPDWVHAPEFKDQSAEDVYEQVVYMDDLRGYQDIMKKVCLKGDGSYGESVYEDYELFINDMVVKATLRAKMHDQGGSVPGFVEAYVDNLRSPKLPWNTILANMLNEMAQDDYSYAKVKRRYLPEILPSLYSEKMGEISVYVDTSGSITKNEFEQFISEIYAIHKSLNPTATKVHAFDTEVRITHTVNQAADLPKLTFPGGGGTHIEPVLDDIRKTKPKAAVIFTDGCFGLRTEDIPRNVPIFWIIHDNKNFNADRGKTIHFSIQVFKCE